MDVLGLIDEFVSLYYAFQPTTDRDSIAIGWRRSSIQHSAARQTTCNNTGWTLKILVELGRLKTMAGQDD
jgi:hypothetical protein